MSETEKLCQRFLRAAADILRKRGWVRGKRITSSGQMCMLGAMDHCGITLTWDDRYAIEKHVASLLPALEGLMDTYNGNIVSPTSKPAHKIAAWNNMIAADGEEVAAKLDLAAESC